MPGHVAYAFRIAFELFFFFFFWSSEIQFFWRYLFWREEIAKFSRIQDSQMLTLGIAAFEDLL